MPGELTRRIRDLREAVRRLKPDLLNTQILEAVHEVLDADADRMAAISVRHDPQGIAAGGIGGLVAPGATPASKHGGRGTGARRGLRQWDPWPDELAESDPPPWELQRRLDEVERVFFDDADDPPPWELQRRLDEFDAADDPPAWELQRRLDEVDAALAAEDDFREEQGVTVRDDERTAFYIEQLEYDDLEKYWIRG